MRIAPGRLGLLAGVTALLVLPASAVPATGGPPPVLARSIYVVRVDPRLCPSPFCGGYWVSRANHSRTRCHDGLLRPRCYVAIAFSEATREPLKTGIPEHGLVRAALGSRPFEGFGELGSITVTELWEPVGRAPPAGDFFRVRDLGVRCVRAPCFSMRAWRLNRPFRATVTRLDLRPAKPTPGQQAQAETALGAPGGLVVSGRIVAEADGGRLLRASQAYLRAATPRA